MSVTVTTAAGTFSETFASAFSLRTAVSTSAAVSAMPDPASPATSSSPAVGQAARWIEPSRHHDQTSSVT